jgi:hypothetical protein
MPARISRGKRHPRGRETTKGGAIRALVKLPLGSINVNNIPRKQVRSCNLCNILQHQSEDDPPSFGNDSQMRMLPNSSLRGMGYCVRTYSIATAFRFNDIHAAIPAFAVRCLGQAETAKVGHTTIVLRKHVSGPKGGTSGNPASKAAGVIWSWVA